MKSLRGNIFEQIASVENIVAAIHSAAKGKRHKRAVRYAETHAEEVGARLIRKRAKGKKLTAYDAQKMTSYSARFKAFGCYRAFAAEVLHNGKLTMSDMASIISRHDRAKAKARHGDVQES